MSTLIQPDSVNESCGVFYIADRIYITSWCCNEKITSAWDSYNCQKCGLDMDHKGTDSRYNFWLTECQILDGMEGPDFVSWISAWTGIPAERLTIEIE